MRDGEGSLEIVDAVRLMNNVCLSLVNNCFRVLVAMLQQGNPSRRCSKSHSKSRYSGSLEPSPMILILSSLLVVSRMTSTMPENYSA